MINKNNFIVITTTLANDEISEKRRNNIINRMNEHELNMLFAHGITGVKEEEIMYNVMLNRFLLARRVDYEYILLCDDDFYPIDDFMVELNKTVDILPHTWEALHLCPGFLWGREYDKTKNKSFDLKTGKPNPTSWIDCFQIDDSGRVFYNIDTEFIFDLNAWVGGPIAMVIKKSSVNKVINKYQSFCNIQHNDRILTKIIDDNTFICYDPLLGYEREEGGSTFKT